MAHITFDRVREKSTTTGSGVFTLAGALIGYRAFSDVAATNDTFYYTIAHYSLTEWEVGLGTYSALNTLTRTTVLASSNAGAAVVFSAGEKDVFLTAPASRFLQLDNNGNVSAPGNVTLGVATTDTVTVNGYMSIGGTPTSSQGLRVVPSALTGTTQFGSVLSLTATSAATAGVEAVRAQAGTAASAFTTGYAAGLWVRDAILGAGSTITSNYGIFVDDKTVGTNNYGIASAVSSGTNKWNIYASGTAANYFAGNVGVGTTAPISKLDVRSGIITSGDVASTTGQVIIQGFYTTADDRLVTLGSMYSTGAVLLGYAVRSDQTALNTFVSTADNSNFARGALTVDDTLVFRNAAAQTTAVGSAVTMTERFRVDSTGAVTATSFNSITGLASVNPLVNGTAAVGTSTLAARQDHVHPTDTSRAATNQTMYIGTTEVAINRASAALALTGISSIDTPKINIQRNANTASGISWYNSATYTAWADYMAQAAQTSVGPTGNITAPTGTLVTSWGMRSFIESTAGYGWTFESGTSAQTTPTVVAEIRSSDGAARFGAVTNAGFLGTGSGNARNHFTQYNSGSAAAASGWIAGVFGDTNGHRPVIGQAHGYAYIGAHDANLTDWRPLQLQNDSSNAIVMIGYAWNTAPDYTYRLKVNGAFAATTKSFLIPHPTKEGKQLRYGSLEGPENGVYVRGKLEGDVIELPEYWSKLVDPDSITVQLTPIGKHQKLYVKDIRDNKVYVGNDGVFSGSIKCFYYVLAERCDVDKLEVEI